MVAHAPVCPCTARYWTTVSKMPAVGLNSKMGWRWLLLHQFARGWRHAARKNEDNHDCSWFKKPRILCKEKGERESGVRWQVGIRKLTIYESRSLKVSLGRIMEVESIISVTVASHPLWRPKLWSYIQVSYMYDAHQLWFLMCLCFREVNPFSVLQSHFSMVADHL